ncbi:MAG: type II toxin-antitoxin system HicA family toxin [Alistipes sp.]|nr:type II toxin-antitoxin system HicA family toxin [Candidatus Alistipes equi]
MTKKVKEVLDILEKNGWKLVRIKGDHRIYYKDGAKRPIVAQVI